MAANACVFRCALLKTCATGEVRVSGAHFERIQDFYKLPWLIRFTPNIRHEGSREKSSQNHCHFEPLGEICFFASASGQGEGSDKNHPAARRAA